MSHSKILGDWGRVAGDTGDHRGTPPMKWPGLQPRWESQTGHVFSPKGKRTPDTGGIILGSVSQEVMATDPPFVPGTHPCSVTCWQLSACPGHFFRYLPTCRILKIISNVWPLYSSCHLLWPQRTLCQLFPALCSLLALFVVDLSSRSGDLANCAIDSEYQDSSLHTHTHTLFGCIKILV